MTDQNFDELQDKYLRLVAEFDNYKKRVQKEKADIVVKTTEDLMSTILDIDDDISIILKSEKNEQVKNVLEMIYRKLGNFLNLKNIEVIEETEYNPDIHEVVSITKGKKGNIDIISKGYRIGDKIIRYPKVILYE